MSDDMLLSPVASSPPTRAPSLLSLPASDSSLNVCFPALPFVAYSSSSRSRCSACHQPILLGDIRVDCLHLDCVSSAHVSQWLSTHPQLARSFMRLPSLAALSPEDRRRAGLVLHTIALQSHQRSASPPPPAATSHHRPTPLSTARHELLQPIREDSLLSPPPPPLTQHLPHAQHRLIRQRTAPSSPSHSATPQCHATPPASGGVVVVSAAKRKRVTSGGAVQVVESEWHEPALLSPAVDADTAMVAVGGGSGRKKRRRSHDYVTMLT